jgi:hypothetical protein
VQKTRPTNGEPSLHAQLLFSSLALLAGLRSASGTFGFGFLLGGIALSVAPVLLGLAPTG